MPSSSEKPKEPHWVTCTNKHNHLEPVEALKDADGIFLTYACKACKKDKLSGYRPDILTRSSRSEQDWGDGDEDY